MCTCIHIRMWVYVYLLLCEANCMCATLATAAVASALASTIASATLAITILAFALATTIATSTLTSTAVASALATIAVVYAQVCYLCLSSLWRLFTWLTFNFVVANGGNLLPPLPLRSPLCSPASLSLFLWLCSDEYVNPQPNRCFSQRVHLWLVHLHPPSPTSAARTMATTSLSNVTDCNDQCDLLRELWSYDLRPACVDARGSGMWHPCLPPSHTLFACIVVAAVLAGCMLCCTCCASALVDKVDSGPPDVQDEDQVLKAFGKLDGNGKKTFLGGVGSTVMLIGLLLTYDLFLMAPVRDPQPGLSLEDALALVTTHELNLSRPYNLNWTGNYRDDLPGTHAAYLTWVILLPILFVVMCCSTCYSIGTFIHSVYNAEERAEEAVAKGEVYQGVGRCAYCKALVMFGLSISLIVVWAAYTHWRLLMSPVLEHMDTLVWMPLWPLTVIPWAAYLILYLILYSGHFELIKNMFSLDPGLEHVSRERPTQSVQLKPLTDALAQALHPELPPTSKLLHLSLRPRPHPAPALLALT